MRARINEDLPVRVKTEQERIFEEAKMKTIAQQNESELQKIRRNIASDQQ